VRARSPGGELADAMTPLLPATAPGGPAIIVC